MKLGFSVNGIEVPAELDVRHINTYINDGNLEVKKYIEQLEDSEDWALRELLKYEPDNQYLIEQILLNEERYERTRDNESASYVMSIAPTGEVLQIKANQ